MLGNNRIGIANAPLQSIEITRSPDISKRRANVSKKTLPSSTPDRRSLK